MKQRDIKKRKFKKNKNHQQKKKATENRIPNQNKQRSFKREYTKTSAPN